tara:strand:- start:287 stop:508 length:222 start_codon:yes stop_codon:yes gene_type:complete
MTNTMNIQTTGQAAKPNQVRCIEGETQQEANSRSFNWGLSDGKSAKEAGRNPQWQRGEHFNAAYEDGFWIGFS